MKLSIRIAGLSGRLPATQLSAVTDEARRRAAETVAAVSATSPPPVEPQR